MSVDAALDAPVLLLGLVDVVGIAFGGFRGSVAEAVRPTGLAGTILVCVRQLVHVVVWCGAVGLLDRGVLDALVVGIEGGNAVEVQLVVLGEVGVGFSGGGVTGVGTASIAANVEEGGLSVLLKIYRRGSAVEKGAGLSIVKLADIYFGSSLDAVLLAVGLGFNGRGLVQS